MKIFTAIFIISFLVIFFSPISVSAADKQWSASGDGISWEDAYNWADIGVPLASDTVTIINTASVLISKTFYAKSLSIGGRNESSLETSDFVYGVIAPDSNTDYAVSLKKDAALTLKGPGDITLKGQLLITEQSSDTEPSFMFTAE